jgi:hypothetical protein
MDIMTQAFQDCSKHQNPPSQHQGSVSKTLVFNSLTFGKLHYPMAPIVLKSHKAPNIDNLNNFRSRKYRVVSIELVIL